MRRSLALSLPLFALAVSGHAGAQTAGSPNVTAPAVPPAAAAPTKPAPVAAAPAKPAPAAPVATDAAPAKPASAAPAKLGPAAPATAKPAAAAPAAAVVPAASAPAETPRAPISPEHVTLEETPPPATPAPGSTAASAEPATHVAAPAAADAQVSATPSAEREPAVSRFHVGLNFDGMWFTRRSYDLFSKDDVAENTGLSLGYAVWNDGPWSVVPEIGFGVDSQSASGLFQGAIDSTELDTKRYYGGVSAHYQLLSFLDPHVRVAAGASVIDVALTPGSAGTSLTDTKTSPFASLGGGFTLHTRAGTFETRSGALRSVVFGLALEGGYVFAKAVSLTPAPEHASGRIPVTDATIGKLDRSAPYIRASLVVRF
ncbi:MAG TPA: hypothetical protein VF395_08815 [Polyangiaceae bacterium]